MSGTTALLQTPVGFLVDRYGSRPFLVGGALLMSLSIAAMGLATSFWQILAAGHAVRDRQFGDPPSRLRDPLRSVDKDRMGRSFALHTFSGNLGFSAGPPVIALLTVAIGWRAQPDPGRPSRRAGGDLNPAAEQHPEGPGASRAEACRERLSGRELLISRTMLLFFAFFMLGSMAGAGVQSWLMTVLHTVKGMTWRSRPRR